MRVCVCVCIIYIYIYMQLTKILLQIRRSELSDNYSVLV